MSEKFYYVFVNFLVVDYYKNWWVEVLLKYVI